jgi:hypothetical protein
LETTRVDVLDLLGYVTKQLPEQVARPGAHIRAFARAPAPNAVAV